MDESLLDRLEQKAVYHAREAERYRVAADVLRDELKGSSGRTARSTRAEGRSVRVDDPHRNTKAMVEVALNQSPRPLHPTDLVSEMLRLGWETTAHNKLNTARTAALRLSEDHRIKRTDDGRYARLGLPDLPEPTDSADEPPGHEPEPKPDPWATPAPPSGGWGVQKDEPPF